MRESADIRCYMVGGFWHSAYSSAKNLWAGCVETVGGMCESFAQLWVFTHSLAVRKVPVRTIAWVLHGLYYFCTHYLPTPKTPALPLLKIGFPHFPHDLLKRQLSI